MKDTLEHKIIQTRENLIKKRKDNQEADSLLTQREELNNTVESLKGLLDSKKMLKGQNSEKYPELEEEIIIISQKLQELNKKKQAMDIRLDELEESAEEEVLLRDELVKLIIERYPDQIPLYMKMQQDMESRQTEALRSDELYQELGQLLLILNSLKEARIAKRNILSYLFGPHRHVLIFKHLHACNLFIEGLLPKLKDKTLSSDSGKKFNKLLDQTIELLEKMRIHCQPRGHIKDLEQMDRLKDECNQLHKDFQENNKQAQFLADLEEKKIEEWLDTI